jgi:hypothetical protein
MLGSTDHLDFLVKRRGKRAICNRESATCVLYAKTCSLGATASATT